MELGAEFIHGDINPVVELCEKMGWSRRQNFTWSHGDGGPGHEPAPDGGIGYYYLGNEKRLMRYDEEDADMKLCNEALWSMSDVEPKTAEADTRSLRQYLRDMGVPDRMLGMADAGYGNTAGGTMDTVPATRAMRYERAWHGDGTELDPDFRMEPSFGVVIDHLASGLDISTSSPVASIRVSTGDLKASEAAMKEYIDTVNAALLAEQDADPAAPSKAASPAPVAAQLPPLPTQHAVTVTTKAGHVYMAHRVVVSVPLPVLRDGDIKFEPALSASKVAAAQSMSFANGVKVGLKFSRRAWPANCHGVVCADTLFPEMWMNSSKGVGGLITGQQCTWPCSTNSVAGSWPGDDEVGSLASGGPAAMPSAPSSASVVGADLAAAAEASTVSTATSGPYSPEPIPDSEPGVLYTCTGFIMGVRADALLASFDQPTIIARMLSQIDEMFGMDAAGAFVGGFVHDWSKEEYIRGAYSTPTTWEAVDGARKLAEPHLGAVYFAGEATAGAVDGQDRDRPENRVHFAPPIVMHGAMQTGSAAACDVARSLGFQVTCAAEDSAWVPTYLRGPAAAEASTASKLAMAREAGVPDDLAAQYGHADVSDEIRGCNVSSPIPPGASSPCAAMEMQKGRCAGLVSCTRLCKQVEAHNNARRVTVKGGVKSQTM